MFVIHKYPISLSADGQYILMPADAQVLHVGMQNGVICLWAKHEANTYPVAPRAVRTVGTGHQFLFADELSYVGTIQDPPFVWHIFVERSPHGS
jgi:hypothetical protein